MFCGLKFTFQKLGITLRMETILGNRKKLEPKRDQRQQKQYRRPILILWTDPFAGHHRAKGRTRAVLLPLSYAVNQSNCALAAVITAGAGARGVAALLNPPLYCVTRANLGLRSRFLPRRFHPRPVDLLFAFGG